MITAGRKISHIVPATKSGPINRLIGTVDIDGQGTNHPLSQVDPFMLLDQATIVKDGMPPFGAHPHRGHSVVTILLQGQEKSWDSFTQKHTTIQGPASYWVDAGSGIFHDETSVIPDESEEKQRVSLFQLWMSVREEDRLKPAALQYETNLPVTDIKDNAGNIVGSIRYHVGGDCTSIKTPHPIVVAHVSQKAGSTMKIPIESTFGGFAAHIEGSVTLGDAKDPICNKNDVSVLADAKGIEECYLEVKASSNDDASYLVCTGEKIGEPWFKKLVANGAVIAKSEEEARQIASQVERYSKEGLESGNFAPFGGAKLSK